MPRRTLEQKLKPFENAIETAAAAGDAGAALIIERYRGYLGRPSEYAADRVWDVFLEWWDTHRPEQWPLAHSAPVGINSRHEKVSQSPNQETAQATSRDR